MTAENSPMTVAVSARSWKRVWWSEGKLAIEDAGGRLRLVICGAGVFCWNIYGPPLRLLVTFR
jgi:hypothetical protein